MRNAIAVLSGVMLSASILSGSGSILPASWYSLPDNVAQFSLLIIVNIALVRFFQRLLATLFPRK